MANVRHALDDKFIDKLPSGENLELDPRNADHQE